MYKSTVADKHFAIVSSKHIITYVQKASDLSVNFYNNTLFATEGCIETNQLSGIITCWKI